MLQSSLEISLHFGKDYKSQEESFTTNLKHLNIVYLLKKNMATKSLKSNTFNWRHVWQASGRNKNMDGQQKDLPKMWKILKDNVRVK
jgi:hypothetical protein